MAVAAFDRGADAVIKRDDGTLARRVAGAHKRSRAAGVQDAFNQDFGAAAALLAAGQPRADHATVVEHQQVAGLKLR